MAYGPSRDDSATETRLREGELPYVCILPHFPIDRVHYERLSDQNNTGAHNSIGSRRLNPHPRHTFSL